MYPENGTNPALCGDSSGTMPDCAPLAVPYVPFQQSGSKRYSQADALANGTLFPGLNLPFHVKASASPLPQSPMTELQALEFVLNELALYLDTHPTDEEAFALFRQYSALEAEARRVFAAAGMPISRGETAESNTYTWLNAPWPWTYQEGGQK